MGIINADSSTVASLKLAEKRKAPPFGLSPPSESKLIQRRKQSQSLNFNSSCRNTSRSIELTKNSSNYLYPPQTLLSLLVAKKQGKNQHQQSKKFLQKIFKKIMIFFFIYKCEKHQDYFCTFVLEQ